MPPSISIEPVDKGAVLMENKSLDLFLLMFNLSQIQSVDDVVRIYIEALNHTYCGLDMRLVAPADVINERPLFLNALCDNYGALFVSPSYESFPAEEQAIIRNSAGLLSVIVENRSLSKQMSDRAVLLEKNLKRSEMTFRNIGEMIPEIIYIIDITNKKTVYVNEAIEKMLGITRSEVLASGFGGVFKYLHPEDFEFVQEHFQNLSKLKEGEICELNCRLADMKGRWHWFIVRETACFFDEEGQPVQVLGCATDITMLKQSETELRAISEEKTVLLREVHHRVKNNLAIISSLLSLQEHSSEDIAVRQALSEGRNRIGVMSLVHEELYKSANFSKIDVCDYFSNLIKRLTGTCNAAGKEVKTLIQIDVIALSISKIIPVALILNELVTNSFKYAFVRNDNPVLEVRFYMKEKGSLCLLVGDNGPGFSGNVDLDASRTLGLQIVMALVRQLNGSITFNSENGCRATLVFSGE